MACRTPTLISPEQRYARDYANKRTKENGVSRTVYRIGEEERYCVRLTGDHVDEEDGYTPVWTTRGILLRH